MSDAAGQFGAGINETKKKEAAETEVTAAAARNFQRKSKGLLFLACLYDGLETFEGRNPRPFLKKKQEHGWDVVAHLFSFGNPRARILVRCGSTEFPFWSRMREKNRIKKGNRTLFC